MLEGPTKDKRTSLLRTIVKYIRKKVLLYKSQIEKANSRGFALSLHKQTIGIQLGDLKKQKKQRKQRRSGDVFTMLHFLCYL
jgi:hypothetical protein